MARRVRSHSKINLGLAVGPARKDGFHELLTVYQTLALHEFVTVSALPATRTAIRLTADHPGVPSTERGDAGKNTAYRMVAGALERLGVAAAVDIRIEKKLPVQGGMGAGSANAAAALLGLERELGRALPEAERMALAAEVGSDVPLFLLGGTVVGSGRGEKVAELPEGDRPGLPCVVALPDVGVSTAAAFQALDSRALTFQQGRGSLERLSRVFSDVYPGYGSMSATETGPSGIAWADGMAHRGDLAENPESPADVSGGGKDLLLALVRTGVENDFEEAVFSQHPSLRSTKRDLLGTPGRDGALYAALSGSGSALFGLYDSHASAEAAQRRVQAGTERHGGMKAIVTKTIGRREYWHTMFAE